MYIYYAKKKSDIAKRVFYDPHTKAALKDEGFYVLISTNKYNNKTLQEIEKKEGTKAEYKRYNIGRKGQQRRLIS